MDAIVPHMGARKHVQMFCCVCLSLCVCARAPVYVPVLCARVRASAYLCARVPARFACLRPCLWCLHAALCAHMRVGCSLHDALPKEADHPRRPPRMQATARADSEPSLTQRCQAAYTNRRRFRSLSLMPARRLARSWLCIHSWRTASVSATPESVPFSLSRAAFAKTRCAAPYSPGW